MRESLMTSVVSILQGGEAIQPTNDAVVPEVAENTSLNLGKPPAVLKEVRARLDAIHKADKADLVEKRADLTAKKNAELAIVKEGETSVSSLMEQGKTREEIIAARSASSVAQELAMGLEREIDTIDDQIELINRTFQTRRDRVVRSLQNLEISTKAWLIDYVQGGNVNRLNPDRSLRAYGQLLTTEQFLKEALDDDDLAARAILACGVFTCPTNVWETLFAVMSQRNRDEFADDQPEAVLERLNNLITETNNDDE